MAKFKLKWTETVSQSWETIVEAETMEKARELYDEGNHITGNEELVETSFLSNELEDVEEVK